MKFYITIVIVSFLIAGCSSSEEPDPVHLCQNLQATICHQMVNCLGGTSADYNDCLAGAESALACGKAQSVGSSYDECLTEVSQSCSWVLAENQIGFTGQYLPADCKGVIILSY